MRIQPRRPPTYIPYLLELAIGRNECRLLFEGIRREGCCQRFQRQRLTRSFNIEREIAPGAPPERLEGSILATIGQEVVFQSVCLAVAHFAAVALVHLLVVEGFRVREPDFRAFSSGYGEDGIGRGQRFPIEKQVNTGSRRQRQRLLGKTVPTRLFIVRRANSYNFARACGRVFRMRQRIWNQAPVIVSGRIGRVSLVH